MKKKGERKEKLNLKAISINSLLGEGGWSSRVGTKENSDSDVTTRSSLVLSDSPRPWEIK